MSDTIIEASGTRALLEEARAGHHDQGQRERALFCYHCGSAFLDDTPVANHQGPRCARCGTDWPRLFAHACIRCGSGSPWLHLSSCTEVATLNNTVIEARGQAHCECGTTQLYRWHWRNGIATLDLLGWGGNGDVLTYGIPASEIQTDS